MRSGTTLETKHTTSKAKCSQMCSQGAFLTNADYIQLLIRHLYPPPGFSAFLPGAPKDTKCAIFNNIRYLNAVCTLATLLATLFSG